MKDLKDIWSAGQSNESTPEFGASDLQSLNKLSDTPIVKLRKNIRINSVFALVFTFLFLYFFFTVNGLWFRITMGLLILSYIAGIWFNSHIIKTYLQDVPRDESLRIYLQTLVLGMRKAFKAVELTALFIYPVAMTAGFLLPLTIENKLHLFNDDAFLWLLLFVLYLVLTPLCFYLTRFLNKKAFGKYIDEIQQILENIDMKEDISEASDK